MRAKVARFYGWSHSEIKSMPFKTFFEYHRCIEKLEAHEMYNAIRIAVYPNMKHAPAQKFANGIRKLAYEGFRDQSKPMTNQELATELARKLGGG